MIVPIDPVRSQTTDVWTRWVPERQAYVQKIPIVIDLEPGQSVSIEGSSKVTPSVHVRFDYNSLPADPANDGETERLTFTQPSDSTHVAKLALLGTMGFPSTGCYQIWVTVGQVVHGPFGFLVRA